MLHLSDFKEQAKKFIFSCIDKMKKKIPEIFIEDTELLSLELKKDLKGIEVNPNEVYRSEHCAD